MHLLGHFLWQGAAVALLAGVTAGAMRRASARARYGVFVGALVLMVACPMITLGLLVSPEIAVSDTLSLAQTGEGADPASANPTPVAASELAGLAETGEGAGPTSFVQLAPYITIAYAIGVAVMLARLVLGLIGGSRLRRASRPVEDVRVLQALSRYARVIGLTCTPAIAFCERVAAPTLVGVVRPMILLPASVMTGLSLEQVEFLLLHELAHVRRYDHWVNVFQRVVEAVFFFHPGVWYVSHRARVEREHCCDDVVLTYGGNARDYAESLISVAACARGAHTPAAALGVAGKESQLRTRILRLLGQNAPQVRLGLSGWLVVGLVMVLGVAAFMEVGAVDVPPITTEEPSTNQQAGVATASDAMDQTELVQQLKDEDWWLRKVAAVQLGETDPKMAPFDVVNGLIGALKDGDERVVAAAAESLGRIQREETIKHLVAALKGSAEVRDAAAKALAHFDSTKVMPLLKIAATDADESMRQGALWAVGMQSGPEATVILESSLRGQYALRDNVVLGKALKEREKLLLPLGQDAEASVRARAATVAAYLDDFSPAEPMMLELAKDPDRQVRAQAVSAFGSQLKPGANNSVPLKVLEEALHDDVVLIANTAAAYLEEGQWEAKDAAQQAWCLTAALKIGEAENLGTVSVDPLVHFLLADWSPIPGWNRSVSMANKLEIVEALGNLHDARAVEPLSEVIRKNVPQGFARESDLTLVYKTIEALINIGDPSAAPVLIEGLNSSVGNSCAQALGKLKATQAVPALIERLDDQKVAEAAAVALMKINDPAGVKALLPAIENPQINGEVRVSAMRILAKTNSPELPGVLSKLAIGSADKYVRQSAVELLGDLKDPQGVAALSEVLSREPDGEVLGVAAKALGTIGGAEAVKVLSQSDRLSPFTIVEALAMIPGQEASDALAAITEENNGIELRQKIAEILRQRNDPRWKELYEKAAADAALKKTFLGE